MEAQSRSDSDPGHQQTPQSELDVWVRTVGGKKKGRIYGLGLESTVLAGPSYFPSQASSCSQWMQRQQIEEQVRKQVDDEWNSRIQAVEAEWNSRVQAAEHERDELRRRVEHNERLLHDLIAKINFSPSATPSFQPSPSQPPAWNPYQSYEAPLPQYAPSGPGRDDDIEEEEEEEEEEEGRRRKRRGVY